MADAPAPAAPGANFLSPYTKYFKNSSVFFAIGVLGILFLLIIPVPKGLLSLMLGLSISLSVLILMRVLLIDKPLELSSFPSILLITALFRLALKHCDHAVDFNAWWN